MIGFGQVAQSASACESTRDGSSLGLEASMLDVLVCKEKSIKKLNKDINLCSYIGKNACLTMINMFGDDCLKKFYSYYEYHSG